MRPHKITRANVTPYRGCCNPHQARYHRDPTKRHLDLLLRVLESHLRNEGTDVCDLLSVLLDLTEVLSFAAQKIGVRAAERARLLVCMGHTGALSGIAAKYLKMGGVGPAHPTYAMWLDLAEAETFYKALDTLCMPTKPLLH
jgi:hypothetical protein